MVAKDELCEVEDTYGVCYFQLQAEGLQSFRMRSGHLKSEVMGGNFHISLKKHLETKFLLTYLSCNLCLEMSI